MKNIICLLSEKIPVERQIHIVNCLQGYADKLNLPFKIDLYKKNSVDHDYHYAISGFLPANALTKFSKLELMLSLNAGVDDILDELSAPTRLGRIVYQPAINRMREYILYCILDYSLLMDKYRKNKSLALWNRAKPFSVSEDTIGIMGLGNVGQRLASTLTELGKTVNSYSRTRKECVNKSFVQYELEEFLSKTHILVNALPLDKSTRGILNKHTLNLLPANSCIINVGRGEHIVEEDLLSALDANKLSRVYLDVFNTEPLPQSHPFWCHEKIFMTPHISGVFDVMDVLETAIEQLKRYHDDGTVVNEVVY